jgi:UDP-N-acetylglucosamine 2-epimerase (non-hydrolysing)
MKIVHVVGARPNFMKIAPTMAALAAREGIEQFLVHTGQHYDELLSGAFFEELDLPEPDHFLGIGSGTHAEQTARIILALEPLLASEAPDAVLVAGDANSTMAPALAAAKIDLPVVHLEAGLRSGDRSMPEEVNRIVADHVADLLLTPSRDADENLVSEGVEPERIRFVGNTMIDSLLRFESKARRLTVARTDYGVEDYVLVTLHRPSLVDDSSRLGEVLDVLDEIAVEHPVLFPVHPRTQETIRRLDRRSRRVRLLDPQPYLRFLSLEIDASAVVTDSGGVQEETTVLGVPCFTLRSTTERPITVSQGTNHVLGIGRAALAELKAALRGPLSRDPCSVEGWDGRAGFRAAAAVVERYGPALRARAALG